jgi:hypothetical protein
MKYRLPYLGDDTVYVMVLLKLFQKYPPPSSEFSITIHKAGQAGGDYTSKYRPPATKSVPETAKLVAHNIVGEYKSHAEQVFKGVTLDF